MPRSIKDNELLLKEEILELVEKLRELDDLNDLKMPRGLKTRIKGYLQRLWKQKI